MRVALLLTQDRGGPVDLTVSLALEVARRRDGPEVIVLGPPPLTSAGKLGDLLVPVHVSSKSDLRGAAELRQILRRVSPDVVHAEDRRAALVAATVARAGVPLAATYHGVPNSAAGRYVESGPFAGRPVGLAGGSRLGGDAAVARLVRANVTPSETMARFLRRQLRVPRLRVIRNGVAVGPALPPPSRVTTFVSVGSFDPCKGMPLLVECFAEVASTREDLRLRLVGDGDERRACEQAARAAGLGARIAFTGYRTDVHDQLRSADAFVLPSTNENLPLALLEAMAASRPCIASSVGAVPEALEGAGLLVEPGDGACLSSALARLADEPELASSLGAAGRRRVEERFSISGCADSHVRLWHELVEGGP